MSIFSQASIDKLGSLSPETRQEGWTELYREDYARRREAKGRGRISHERSRDLEWNGYAVNVVRKYQQRGTGRVNQAIAEEVAQEAWTKLWRRIDVSPLVLPVPALPHFIGFLKTITINCCIDAWTREVEQGGKGIPIPILLKKLKTQMCDDQSKLWLQEMIELERAGIGWHHMEELSKHLGVEVDHLEKFANDVVLPAIRESGREATLDGRREKGSPPEGPETVVKKQLAEEFWALIEEGITRNFPDSKGRRGKTKVRVVAEALIALLREGRGLKGEGFIDHAALIEELQNMGELWKSSKCPSPHDRGPPSASACPYCQSALAQQVSRIRKKLEQDADLLGHAREVLAELSRMDRHHSQQLGRILRQSRTPQEPEPDKERGS